MPAFRDYPAALRYYLVVVIALGPMLAVTVAAAGFLLLPGDMAHKAHLVLQGVCAQRPSHSFLLSGHPLPVDARMTGIYLGAAASLLWRSSTSRRNR